MNINLGMGSGDNEAETIEARWGFQMLPAHVQRDEDAALGAAWRRCEAALPKGWMLELGNWVGELTRPKELAPYEAIAEPLNGQALTLYGHTPIEALTALAEALEKRSAG